MRPLLFAAAVVASGLATGIAAPGGSATTATPGDGCLVVSKGYGKVTINLTRGVVFGRFQSGTLTYSDFGQDTTKLPTVPQVQPTKVKEHLWLYGPADNVRFRASGPTKLTINAQWMDLSVAGKGTAVLTATNFIQDIAGTYSNDAASFCDDPTTFLKMPVLPTRVQISSPIQASG
ncbi:MAG TPA: hypothetical protein VLJ76_07170 [Gaiellaceae bacterium]|nr:hypothetical protein [Gaiellaceae bacterium]